MLRYDTRKGLTLVEILIVVAIMGVVATISLSALVNAGNAQALQKDADRVVSVLERTRSLTLSSSGDSQHGVHFESDRVVLFSGSIYNVANAGNQIELLNSRVQLSLISLAGGVTDVVFERLTGKTAATGTVNVSLKSDTTKLYTISISSTGLVEIQ